MPYRPEPISKPAKKPIDLLAHLQARGLTVNDEAAALHSLETVGYYRLLIYMRALQVMPGDDIGT